MPPDDSEDEDGEINSDAEEEVVEPLQGESEEEVEDGDEETVLRKVSTGMEVT